jgi:thiamine biosynthesis lipoprotein
MGASPPEPYSETRMMLHTLVEIKAYGDNVEDAVKAAFNEIERTNRFLNNYDPQSEVSLINATAGLKEVLISPETLEALMTVQFYGSLTDGALDITVGPLLAFWGFTQEEPGREAAPPSSNELDKIRQIVDYKKLRLDAINGTAMLLKSGMWIDAGSFTKGYAVDRAARVLKKNGVHRALIAAGGTILAVGKKSGEKYWQVGIRHPRQEGRLMGSVAIEDQAISTSGDYERFYRFKERRICHIIDPRSGQPIESVQSISVIAPSAMASDALSTALFVLGTHEGLLLVNNLPDTEALIVDQEGAKHTSRGWPAHQN